MVLGMKYEPLADPTSESDNPYLFSTLDRAIDFAKGQEFAVVVRLDELFTVNNICPA